MNPNFMEKKLEKFRLLNFKKLFIIYYLKAIVIKEIKWILYYIFFL